MHEKIKDIAIHLMDRYVFMVVFTPIDLSLGFLLSMIISTVVTDV
jgi:hypothetical protein